MGDDGLHDLEIEHPRTTTWATCYEPQSQGPSVQLPVAPRLARISSSLARPRTSGSEVLVSCHVAFRLSLRRHVAAPVS